MDQLKMKKVTKVVFASVLLFALALSLIFALSSYAATTARAEVTLSGSGTAADPYLIGTKAELEEFRDIIIGANGQTQNRTACARLTADIDLEGNESNQWVPIGNSGYTNGDYNSFQGIFDGADHTVSGLYINQPSKTCLGFFGNARNATIKRLTVRGSITGLRRLGGIVGSIGDSYGSNCTIYKCTNECTIYSPYEGTSDATTGNHVGGIVGYVYKNGTVINACVNKGNISTAVRTTPNNNGYTYHEAYAGGIVGFSINGTLTIKNCVNYGNISSATGVAGIVAYATGENSVITGCFNKGTITSNPTWNGSTPSDCKCGGIAGMTYADITHCGNEGNIVAHGSNVGGIVSFVYGADYEVSCCYNTGNISGATYGVGGIVAQGSYVPVTNCYNAGNITINTTSGNIAGIITSVYNSTTSYVFNYGRLIENVSYSYKARGAIVATTGNGAAVNHAYYLNTGYGRGIGWNSNKSGPEAGCSSTALTAEQMRNQSSFAGWDFDNVWYMGADHPELRHVHDFSYELEGDTVTATCDRPFCTVAGGEVHKLTLHAPTLDTVGGEGSPLATLDETELASFNAATGLNVTTADIVYQVRQGDEVTDLAEAPTARGDYTAMLPVNDLVIRVDYKIDKPRQNVSVSMGSWTEGEPACDPVLVGNLAGLPVTYFYKVRGAEDSTYTTVKPGLEGYYTVKAVVAESETYSEEAVTANFSIKVIRTSVVTEEGTPNSVVDNLDEDLAISLLSEEEQTLYDGGESLRVYLEVKAESETTEISAEDKTAARAAVEESGASEGMYLDLSLFKKIGENEPTAVHESENAFDITVDVPEELATPDFGYIRTYSVIRVHNGVATELPTTYANGKISFSTDRFSTYLIAYSDNFDEDGDYIEFTTTVTGELVRYVDDQNIGDTVTVTYKITHNDGFNSLLLIPQYDTEVFSIQSISASEVALGAATVTQGDGTKKILLENTGAKYASLDGENEFFLTVTYSILAPAAGEFEFGLDLTSEGEN
ncbi:MAG TPA: hypothetical protein DCG79_02940, partial [Clostridiales bacterium]|nr:hypothetical protein [Clostridiales bacterium]